MRSIPAAEKSLEYVLAERCRRRRARQWPVSPIPSAFRPGQSHHRRKFIAFADDALRRRRTAFHRAVDYVLGHGG